MQRRANIRSIWGLSIIQSRDYIAIKFPDNVNPAENGLPLQGRGRGMSFDKEKRNERYTNYGQSHSSLAVR